MAHAEPIVAVPHPEVGPTKARAPRARRFAHVAALAILPAVLVVVFYYGRFIVAREMPGVGGDARYYLYQVSRAADLGGRFWRSAVDEPVGRPYPSTVAKLPQLYEGLDLQLVSVLTARLFSPDANYWVLVALVLVVNGWIAAWLAWRLSGSFLW